MRIIMNDNEIRIIEAAYSEFMEHGYSQAKTLNIAANAGVNESTIFRNFKSKKNLFHVSIEYCTKKALEIDFNILEYQEDWSLDIERVIRYLFKINLGYTSSFRLLIKRKLVKDEVLEHINESIDMQKNLLKNYLTGIQKRNGLKPLDFMTVVEFLNSSIFCDSFELQSIKDTVAYQDAYDGMIRFYTDMTVKMMKKGEA